MKLYDQKNSECIMQNLEFRIEYCRGEYYSPFIYILVFINKNTWQQVFFSLFDIDFFDAFCMSEDKVFSRLYVFTHKDSEQSVCLFSIVYGNLI